VRSYKSDLFGTLPSPSSFDELFPLLHDPHEDWMVRMWRGQGDIDWPIHSTAYRRLAGSTSNTVKEWDVRYYEKQLLERAEHRGLRLHEGRELSDFDLLARLRHHGAATRFIDATRNALIGL
jgi:FRG domain